MVEVDQNANRRVDGIGGRKFWAARVLMNSEKNQRMGLIGMISPNDRRV